MNFFFFTYLSEAGIEHEFAMLLSWGGSVESTYDRNHNPYHGYGDPQIY